VQESILFKTVVPRGTIYVAKHDRIAQIFFVQKFKAVLKSGLVTRISRGEGKFGSSGSTKGEIKVANIVLQAMADILARRLDNDKAALEDFLNEKSQITVSLADVVVALDVILEDIANIADYDMDLTEYRMIAIVESLDEVTKARIKAKFAEVEDDLFDNNEGEKK
jgi:hypothetical protein